MAEQSPEMLAALQALLAQAQQQPVPAAGGGWAQPQPTAALQITGISIPVKVETPIGNVRVYLHLPAECGQSPQALMGAIQAIANAGYQLDVWKPKDQGWGNGSGSGGSGGGGWSGNGNNYAGGANYGRGGFGGGRRW